MQARVMRMIASVGCWIAASGMFSTVTSCALCITVARMVFPFLLSGEIGGVVARLLHELIPAPDDVGFVNFALPVAGADLFEGDGHRLIAVVENARHITNDGVGQPLLLLVGLTRPQFYYHVRHRLTSPAER